VPRITEVELETAFGWNCPGCKTRNYVEGVFVEFSEEDREEIIEEYGEIPADFQNGMIITKPEDVTCRKCGIEFDVKEDLEDDAGGE
jgi:predicted nucleic-acid-binding Zn-ribbon protein